MTTINLRTPNRPPPPPLGLRPLFTLRISARRWPFALRAAICTGAPLLLEWAAADLTAGLTATLGAFTALYGLIDPI